MESSPSVAGAIDQLTLQFDRDHRSRIVPVGQPLYLRGWAIDAAARALPGRLAVVLDDTTIPIPLTAGLRRDDLAIAFGSNAVRLAGFEAIVPPVFGVGSHGLHVVCTDASGTHTATCASMDFHAVESLQPSASVPAVRGVGFGEVDVVGQEHDLRSDAERAGRHEISVTADGIVRGWAFDTAVHLPYDQVGAIVDDRWFVSGEARQPYVGESSTAPAAIDAGFTIRFVGSAFQPGEHELQVVVRRAGGPWLSVGERAGFEVVEELWPWLWALPALRQPTQAAITACTFVDPDTERARTVEPAKRTPLEIVAGHGLYLRGWAVDAPIVTPASAVYLAIDGRRRDAIPARYGRRAPGCPGFPGVAGGFTALVPTSGLSEGPHALELLVLARNYRAYYVVPDALRFEIVEPSDSDDAGDEVTPRAKSLRLRERAP